MKTREEAQSSRDKLRAAWVKAVDAEGLAQAIVRETCDAYLDADAEFQAACQREREACEP